MKNFTKQITNKTLFKPTRWLLMALLLLLGTSSAWAYCTSYNGSYKVYFDASTVNFAEGKTVNLMFEKNDGSGGVTMSQVSGTRYLYLWNSSDWGSCNVNKLAFFLADGAWGWENNSYLDSRKNYALAATNIHTLNSNISSNCLFSGNLSRTNNYTLPTYTITLNIVGSGKVTIKNNAGTALFTNAAATTQTISSVGYLTYLKNITATPSNGYKLSSIKIGDTDYTEAYKSGNDTQSGYDLTGNVTITVTFNCTTPTATRKINSVNYNGCDKVNVVLSGAINDPIYGMLVRYEGTKTSSQITAPTDGTTYNLNDEIGEGVVVAYGMTNASQFQNMPMPDVTTVYTFAYYEYHKNCKYYVLAGDLKTTELRTPTVTTADATNVNGANATLGGTYIKQGSGAGIEYYGIIWTEKPAGSTLQDINKAGSVGVGNSFTVDVTFDVSGTYKYKAFINSNATGACEIGYGEEKSITVSVCDQPTFSLQGNLDGTVTVDYTGNAQKPTITGDVTPTSVRYSGNTYDGNGPTDAGTYTVTVSANASGEFCAVTDKEIGTFVINQISQPTPLTLTGVETTYCTVPNGPITLSTTGGDGDGAVSYQIVNDGTTADASITTNKLSITSAGTLKLQAIKAADTNFKQAESEEVTVTIYADIEAGSIIASATTVCQDGNVTLTLSGHTADVDNITWYADDEPVATGSNTEYTASNLQETTSYKVKVTRQDVSCPEKTKVTEEPIQISVDRTSAITLSGNEATECTGTSINLKEKVDSNTGTVTWYSNEACTILVANPERITVNGNATYYAKAKNGECPATEAVSYAITAKGVTITSQDPATVHPYEVTTFTASGSASWEISTNPSTGAALDNNDPVFSGKTTAYITKADDTRTTFKGEAATGYTISATAEECTTTKTFNVEDDPNNYH